MPGSDTRLSSAVTGDGQTSSMPPVADESDNGASLLIESPVVQPAQPQREGRAPAKRHDFPDGGGSGGAEAFRREKVKTAGS